MTHTVNNYEQSAIDFLNATNTTFKADFEKFDKYFNEDVHPRNIFKITLQNSKHKYSFRFGSSLKDSLKNSNEVICEKYFDFYIGYKYEGLKTKYLSYSDKIEIQALKAAKNFEACKKLLNKQKARDNYNIFVAANSNKYTSLNIISFEEWFENIAIKLTNKTSDFATKNWGEPIQADTIIYPSAYDVLASLTKYDIGNFEDFCADFGYDADSRKAYKIYKAVKRESENIQMLFSQSEIEQLQEIN